MTSEVVNQPIPNNKRKFSTEEREEESEDEDMKLFLQMENEKNKKIKPDANENKTTIDAKSEAPTNENKKEQPKTPKAAKTPETTKPKTPATNSKVNTTTNTTGTPKSVQTKLPFKTIQPSAESSKTPLKASDVKEMVVKRADGDWFIEDYLVDPEWRSLLKDEFSKKYFTDINNVIKEGYKKNIVRPPKELVFNAFNTTSIKKIKVVVIGQDPYHDDNQAHGLSFSVPKGIKLPPSLRNIITELKNDIPGFVHDEKLGGCLQVWAERGVFLLNTFLTVEAHKAGSHSKIGWDIFTDRAIKIISEKNNGCVFLLWGAFAQKKASLINSKVHKVIKCAHPSPFSVQQGFFGSKCFSKANEFLKSIGKEPIDWNLKE